MKNSRYLLAVSVLILSFIIPALANAATLQPVSVSLGRLGLNAGSGGAGDGNDMLVTLKFATTAGVDKVKVTFPSDFTITTGTPTAAVTGFPATPASITGLPGTLSTAATAGSRTIVVSGVGAIDNSTLYGFIIPAGSITNPGTAGTYGLGVESENSSGTAIDAATASVSITANNNSNPGDQINVSASVAPSFTFSLSSDADTVPQVDSSTVSTSSGVTMTVTTNSPLGYTAYVKSKNGALQSPSTSGSISSTGFDAATATGAPSMSAGTSFYGFLPNSGPACSSCTGSLTFDNAYSESSTGTEISSGTKAGAFNSTNFASFVSRNGYTSGDQVTLKERVAAASTVPYATDYADTLTIVAAGNF